MVVCRRSFEGASITSYGQDLLRQLWNLGLLMRESDWVR